ncbi:MAG: zinc-ribbon domain-containing protein [Prevotella sp.]|nr:zinc-ribbon domain-containing protein [Prevotella sp.]
MTFCSFCGTKLINGARFCPNCGRPKDKLYKQLHEDVKADSSSGIYKFVGIAAIIMLVFLGFVGLSYDGNNQSGETFGFFSSGLTTDDIMSIRTADEMQSAICNTTWTHTDKGDIWYKFVFKEGIMIHYAAFPSDGHWRYLGEVEYSIVENRSSYDGKRYIAAVFDIAKYDIPVEFNFSNCHLYSFGLDIGGCKLGDYEWD